MSTTTTIPFHERLTAWRAEQPEYRAFLKAATNIKVPMTELRQMAEAMDIDPNKANSLRSLYLRAAEKGKAQTAAQWPKLQKASAEARDKLADLNEQRLDATTDRERERLDAEIVTARFEYENLRDAAAVARNAHDTICAARHAGLLP